MKEFAFKIEIPGLLSVLTGGDRDAYVPGLIDHVQVTRRKEYYLLLIKWRRGKYARNVLAGLQKCQDVK